MLPLPGKTFMAEDEGFEPPQTESESGVLPLHKSPVYAKRKYYYTKELLIVKEFFSFYPFSLK